MWIKQEKTWGKIQSWNPAELNNPQHMKALGMMYFMLFVCSRPYLEPMNELDTSAWWMGIHWQVTIWGFTWFGIYSIKVKVDWTLLMYLLPLLNKQRLCKQYCITTYFLKPTIVYFLCFGFVFSLQQLVSDLIECRNNHMKTSLIFSSSLVVFHF